MWLKNLLTSKVVQSDFFCFKVQLKSSHHIGFFVLFKKLADLFVWTVLPISLDIFILSWGFLFVFEFLGNEDNAETFRKTLSIESMSSDYAVRIRDLTKLNLVKVVLVLGSSQFLLLPQLTRKILITLKVVKNGSKVIILLRLNLIFLKSHSACIIRKQI